MTTSISKTQPKKIRLVNGVGVNDAAHQVYSLTRAADGRTVRWACPVYRMWTNMLHRCYGAKYQARYPTYRGCYVADEWHKFSVFSEWVRSQLWEGNHLDKDILVPGNKGYSPETCVFVPGALNLFLTDSAGSRGLLPVGVTRDARTGKYKAQCCDPETREQEYLGTFATQEEASEAWRARKHQHAVRLAGQQADPRIAEALRTRYAKPVDTTNNAD